jgi:magnesium chelatase subunit H
MGGIRRQGLGPIETTMLIALPEIDGATNPTVFGGRHGPRAARAAILQLPPVVRQQGDGALPGTDRQPGREDTSKPVLRRKANAEKKVGIVLFGFPPNAGAIGHGGLSERLREPAQHAARA